MSWADADLVLACLEGQQGAWDAFVDRFSKLIYWSIAQTVQKTPSGGLDDFCEETFQEVFSKLLEKEELAKLRDAKNVRKFISVIASHAAMDKLKRLGRYEKKNEAPEIWLSEDGVQNEALLIDENPSSRALEREQEEILNEILEALAPRERFCVEGYYVEGKSHRELGEILGFPRDTVSSILRRTKEKIKRRFTEKGLTE